MFRGLISQLTGAGTMVFRMLRSNASRMTSSVRSKARYTTSVSRQASKAVGKVTQGISQIGQRPTKREDFIETKHSFVSKSFLTILVLVLIGLAALIYFVLAPLAMRYFFTAHIQKDESKLESYTGKVITYYDADKDHPCYKGYLKDGKLQGNVEEYDADGELVFVGNYTDGSRSGEGAEYADGKLIYEGSFEIGQYSGRGRQYEDGLLVYSGSFSVGQRSGEDGCLYYPNGTVAYRGAFNQGEQTGEGTEYYENGLPRYTGSFVKGVWQGSGILYDENGDTVYSGSFADGLFEGEGTLYLDNDFKLNSSFIEGVQGGSAQIGRNGTIYYIGSATDSEAHGQGEVYDRLGNLLFTGTMRGGTIDGSCLLGLTMDEVKAALGDSRYTETEKTDGILLETTELGLKVFFSYPREEDGERVAFDVSLERVSGYDEGLDALLWSFTKDIDAWRRKLWPTTSMLAGEAAPRYSAQAYGDRLHSCIIYPEGYNDCTVWMDGSECFLLQWTVAQGQVAAAESYSAVEDIDPAAILAALEETAAEEETAQD